MIDNKKHLTNSKAAKNKRAGQLNRYSTSKLNNRNSNMTNKLSKVNDKVLAKDSKAMKNCMQSIYENILKAYVTQSKVNKDSTVICLYEVSRGGKVYPDLLQLLGPVVDETKIKYIITKIDTTSDLYSKNAKDEKIKSNNIKFPMVYENAEQVYYELGLLTNQSKIQKPFWK